MHRHGHELVLPFACDTEITDVEVDEGDHRLRIEVRGIDHGSSDDCTSDESISLARPLGQREVVVNFERLDVRAT